MLSLIRIYVLPLREKSSSKSGDVRRKMNSSAKQILIGWIYRRIGFLKRGMKKQIKPLAAILRFLDFSIPPYRHFERSEKSSLHSALSCFLRRSILVFCFHTYDIIPSCKKDPSTSLGMTLRGIALSQHIRCTLREINPFPPYRHFERSEKSSLHSALSCFLRRWIPVFCYHTYDIIPSCKKDPSTSVGMTIQE